ncbi:MAG TPA: 50S ribosomal protein L11 methyltransferase [Chloroflexia bacterium]|nr:50S ribosomal protein L11 methyltransferase [Chloroflexia bacterium]
MNWLELSVETEPEAVESISELFARYGYNGGVVVEQPLVSPQAEAQDWEQLLQPAIDPTRPVSVRTYLACDEEAPQKQRQIEEAVWHLGQMRQVGPLRVRECREEDWANAWKDYYGIQRMGERIVIKPSWLQYEPQEGDVILDLDPGMAFGTGLHPTTRLCLAALEEYVRPQMNILDLGTGSGILAIAAAKLGGPTSRVTALDTDLIAVEATQQNVERNALAGQIEVRQGSTLAAQGDGPYTLIVANILASVIIELARSLYELVEPGGTLITSGIFIDRGEKVVEALEKASLPVRERRQEGDWLCLVSVRER